MTNDERPASELRNLARQEAGGLSDEARARVLASLKEQGPRLVQRARFQRQVVRAGATVAGLALAVLGAFVMARSSPVDSGGASPLVARACEARPVEAHDFELQEDGGQVLDLQDRAFVRAEPGSKIQIVENVACRLVLTLEEGRVDVHARDLASGELEVLTREGAVRVHGTIFSVARVDGDLTVDVAEGAVEVSTPEEPKATVRQGQRLRRHKRQAARTSLEESEEIRLLLAVGAIDPEDANEVDEALTTLDGEATSVDEASEPPRRKTRRVLRKKRRFRSRAETTSAPDPIPEPTAMTPEIPAEPPPPTLGELLSQAEALKRSGDLHGARRALRRAGEMAGPDARAAWIALARLELQAGNTRETRGAVAEYHRRGGGPLEPEGAWLLVRAEERAGRVAEARSEAQALIARWPRTPQAEEARRWLLRADAGADL